MDDVYHKFDNHKSDNYKLDFKYLSLFNYGTPKNIQHKRDKKKKKKLHRKLYTQYVDVKIIGLKTSNHQSTI